MGVDNIIIGLLINLIKKNQTYLKEGFIFSDEWAEIELDVSDFEERLIKSSIEEISNSKKYISEENQIYYFDYISCSYFDLTNKIIRLNIAKELFIDLRNKILKKRNI